MGELDHVRWIGGGSGAGKTSVAALLSERYGLRHYSTDATIHAHAGRLDASSAPLLDRFRRMDMDERWVRAGAGAVRVDGTRTVQDLAAQLTEDFDLSASTPSVTG